MKTYEEFINESKDLSYKKIIDYIKDITPDNSDVPDYFIKIIHQKKPTFTLKKLKISDVLEKDHEALNYVESKEKRYSEGGESSYEPDEKELSNPIVIFNDEVYDGYSRLSTLYYKGKKFVDAYVSNPY